MHAAPVYAEKTKYTLERQGAMCMPGKLKHTKTLKRTSGWRQAPLTCTIEEPTAARVRHRVR